MALSIAQAVAELQHYATSEGFSWDTEVTNLQQFGFQVDETSLKTAVERLINVVTGQDPNIPQQPSGQIVQSGGSVLAGFGQEEVDPVNQPGEMRIVAIAEA